MFGKKNNEAQELMKKYGIPVRVEPGTSTITNFDVLREEGSNKRVTVIRDADGEVMMVTERDLHLGIF